MGFNYAGSMGGAGAPLVRKFLTGEDMYVGQLIMSAKTGGVGGHVQIADAPTLLDEDVLNPWGFVSGIVDGSRAYTASVSGTAQYGDKTTYTTTQSVVADTGASEVEVTYILPMNTIIRAPIYNAAWGTALTEQVVTSANSGGVTITATGDAITDMMDDHCTAYCRSGANRGHYRVVNTTTSTTASTVTVPFPYGIVVGDVFVISAGVLGNSFLDFPASADCIDGNNALAAAIEVFYHTINLEESGKEYAEFSLLNFGHGHGTYDAIST